MKLSSLGPPGRKQCFIVELSRIMSILLSSKFLRRS